MRSDEALIATGRLVDIAELMGVEFAVLLGYLMSAGEQLNDPDKVNIFRDLGAKALKEYQGQKKA